MQSPNTNRYYVILIIFSLTVIVFIFRLFYLQVIDEDLKNSADNNSRRYVTQYPARGLILDRKGIPIVFNEAAYDLMVTPRMVRPFDTMDLCGILDISREQVRENFRQARAYSRYKPSVFMKQISSQTYAILQERLHKFTGFYVQPRTIRQYQQRIAPHLLGYVGEVDEKMMAKNSYYKMGDYIGVSGLEKAYEEELRGRKGVKILLVDVNNAEKGSYKAGAFDTAAVVGKDLVCTLDSKLQAYGEHIMQNMKGSVVAIEPSTGEILAMVSMPMYDPNLLVGRTRSVNYSKLQNDPEKPLINRATNARYSPGSTFKTLQALVLMQMGGITEDSRFPCNGPASQPIRCTHHHGSPVTLLGAIEQSCNPYFWQAYRNTLEKGGSKRFKENYNEWRRQVLTFGFGTALDTDIPDILDGNIPTDAYYNRYYGDNGWRAMTIRSLSIGQGEVLVTPLQLANLMATICNQGFYYPPHMVRSDRFREKIQTSVDKKYFPIVIEGMSRVNEFGTGRAWKLPNDIKWGGKTGTVQNAGVKDHSIFVGFAPVENPQIAIAVVVENAGFGATWAAPVASLMIEKYLTDSITRPWVEENLISFQ
jgi:penicillin-binding protein 2